MATTVQSQHVFWEEKISIEPDLGDQRQSTYKALPSPPKTPKRVMMKYRFSGVFPLVLSLAAFVLSLVVVLAGQNEGMFEGQYLVALNTSRFGQDMVTLEEASATSTAPLKRVNQRANPDKPSTNSLGDAINGVAEGIVDQSGTSDFYYVYLQKICSGTIVGGDGSNSDSVRVNDCRSYEEAGDSMSSLSVSVGSSMVMGQSRVSMPMLAKLVSSLDSMLGSLDGLRKAIFAFLVITMVGSMLSAVSIVPAMYFPQSRLLVYLNLFWPGLASVFALVAATLLSGVIVLGSIMNRFSGTVGVQIRLGGIVLLFVWLSFVFVGLVTLYWASVWFVESRKSSLMKRRRDADEIGHWRGIGQEVWRDVKGRRRKPSMRTDI